MPTENLFVSVIGNELLHASPGYCMLGMPGPSVPVSDVQRYFAPGKRLVQYCGGSWYLQSAEPDSEHPGARVLEYRADFPDGVNEFHNATTR